MTRAIKLAWALGAVAVIGLPAAGVAAVPRARVEQPAYRVEATHDDFEVRRYSPRIVAEVEVEGAPRSATNDGFRILADYIFGNNVSRAQVAMTAPVERRASEKIAMTAPVDRTKTDRAWIVAFTMPSKYTMQTLPEPVDERITLRQVPSKRYAVSRFSGAPSEVVVSKRMDALLEDVAAAGYVVADAEPTYSRYDPPWTPPFMRRNEILVELEGGADGS